jgi:hypothetical protein
MRTRRAVTRQLIVQPSITRHRFAAIAPDLVGLAAQAASRGGVLDEVFGGNDLIARRQPKTTKVAPAGSI